jgi:hypothetical protein
MKLASAGDGRGIKQRHGEVEFVGDVEASPIGADRHAAGNVADRNGSDDREVCGVDAVMVLSSLLVT